MRILITVITAVMALTVSAEVQEASDYPQDAQLISDVIEEWTGTIPLVSLNQQDSTLVLFVSMGGEWTGSDQNWTELILICSYALSLDFQRDWDLEDIAVSFGDSWCQVSVEDLLYLSSQDIPEETFLIEMIDRTAVNRWQ